MILASLSRPAIMAGIRVGIYRARRLPSGQWVIDKASLLPEGSETPKRRGRKLDRRAEKGPAPPTSSTPQAEGSSP
jgi:hypothetical protein